MKRRYSRSKETQVDADSGECSSRNFNAFFRAYQFHVEHEDPANAAKESRAAIRAQAEVDAAARGLYFHYTLDHEADEAWDGFCAEPRYILRCAIYDRAQIGPFGSRGEVLAEALVEVNEFYDPRLRVAVADLYVTALSNHPRPTCSFRFVRHIGLTGYESTDQTVL